MLFSRFNVYSQKGDDVFIFNTLTSALITLSASVFEALPDAGSQETITSLLDSGILIREEGEDLRKYRYMQYSSMFARDSVSLHICPTLSCNFSCFYCFEGQNKPSGSMSDEVEDALVEFLKLHAKKKIGIVWFGGEPLLGLPRIHSIAQRLIEAEVPFTSSLITNGSLLAETDLSLLENLKLEFIQVSMDGVKAQHDARRFFASGKGSFDIIINGIERVLAETTIPLTVQVALDKSNRAAFEDLWNFLQERFPNQIAEGRLAPNFNAVRNRTGFDADGVCFNPHEFYDYLGHLDVLNIGTPPNRHMLYPAKPCMYRTVDHYAIAPNGDMFKCVELVRDSSRAVGNLLQKQVSFRDLSESALRYEGVWHEECMQCNVLPVCGGGCPLDRERDAGENRAACNYQKYYVTDILSRFATENS